MHTLPSARRPQAPKTLLRPSKALSLRAKVHVLRIVILTKPLGECSCEAHRHLGHRKGDVTTFMVSQGVRESRGLVPYSYRSLLGSALSNCRMSSKELSTSRWWRLAPTVM